jgi:uncharacterized protein (TIGR01777 family)
MKIVLPGGSGQVGRMLVRHLAGEGHDCVVLSRRPVAIAGARVVRWRPGAERTWEREIDGADVVINLAGRSVNCRYTERNLAAMMASRVDSVRAVGRAIASAAKPPRVWLQAATATIYAHRYDAANDEATGRLGGDEPGVPALWARSVEIARAWERELEMAPTPATRKVALRSAMVMSPDRGGVFDMLARLCRWRLGRQGDGRQFVSWIHEDDFVAAIRFLIAREDLAGAVNLAAPEPLPNRAFVGAIHAALGHTLAVPVPAWALRIGAVLLRTETELVLKSRRVVPGRLLAAGFAFRHPAWPEAARDLVAKGKRR